MRRLYAALFDITRNHIAILLYLQMLILLTFELASNPHQGSLTESTTTVTAVMKHAQGARMGKFLFTHADVMHSCNNIAYTFD